jgi:hypothetical protein
LGFLCLGELYISLFQNILQAIDFLSFLIEIGAESKLGFLRFFGGDAGALDLQLLLNLLVKISLSFLKCFGAFTEKLLALGNVCVFLRQALLVVPSYRLQQWRR